DLVAVGDPESGGVVAEVVCVCRLSGAGAGRSTLGAGAAPAGTRAPPRRPGAPLPHGGGGGPAGPAPRSLVIVQLPPPVGLAIFRTNVDISDPCRTAGGPRLRPGQHRTPTPAQGAGPSHAAGLVPRILSHLSSLIMYRPTVYLATLLLAGLISLAPTASAQSAVDCPNTIRAVNGCDDYVPARVAQPAPQRAVPPSDAPKSTQGRSARPPVSAPAARRPAVVESGGLTFYTSRTDFDAANPGTTLEDFNDIAAPVGTWCGSTSPADENTDN